MFDGDFRDTSERLAADFLAVYADSLERLLMRFRGVGGLDEVADALRAFCEAPGKALRPRLFLGGLVVFQSPLLNDSAARQALLALAAAQEHFHNFLLIHDDVIDASVSRRGKPTCHEHLKGRGMRRDRLAENIAITVGNVVYSHAMEAFLDEALPAEPRSRALLYFLRIAQDTGMGEALELANLQRPLQEVSPEMIETTYRLKTSRYTFEAPLCLAAYFSGRDDVATMAVLRAAMDPVGVAFQVENDMHELDLDPETALNRAYDLQQGIKTLFLLRFFETASAGERTLLEQVLAEDGAGVSRGKLSALFEAMCSSPVREELKNRVDSEFEKSRAVLEGSSALTVAERVGLLALLDSIHARRRHSESAAMLPAG